MCFSVEYRRLKNPDRSRAAADIMQAQRNGFQKSKSAQTSLRASMHFTCGMPTV
jgi:hypothetical protein